MASKNIDFRDITMWIRTCGKELFYRIVFAREQTFFSYAKDPKTKGREGKTDMDGNILSAWSSDNGQQLIAELVEEDWDEFVTSNKHVLVMWYTPFCIRCFDVIKPELLKTAEALVNRDNLKIAVVDASDEKELKERFEIERLNACQSYSSTVIVP